MCKTGSKHTISTNLRLGDKHSRASSHIAELALSRNIISNRRSLQLRFRLSHPQTQNAIQFTNTECLLLLINPINQN